MRGKSISRHCEERKRRSNPSVSAPAAMDCFAEPVIGRRFAPTRWLAMTETTISVIPGRAQREPGISRNESNF
jgi:hypothetical protein